MTETETLPDEAEQTETSPPPEDTVPLELRTWGLSGQPSSWALSTWSGLIDTIRAANIGLADAAAVQAGLDAQFPDAGYQAADVMLAHPPSAAFAATVDGTSVRVDLADDADLDLPDEQVRWDWGDEGYQFDAGGYDHDYGAAGTYTIRCTIPVGGVVYTTTQEVEVGETPEEQDDEVEAPQDPAGGLINPGVLGRDATVFESATDDEPNTTVSPEESQEQADAVETYTRLAPGQTWSGPDDQPGVEQHPDPDPAESVPDPEQEESDAYDPSDHTVDDVLAYATDHPDEVEAIRVAEEQGKARVGILDKL